MVRLSGATGWFDAISPAGWANGRLGLAENTRGGIRPGHLAGDRRLTLANGQGITYAPQLSIGGTPRAQVISNLSQPLNYTNGTVADTATNTSCSYQTMVIRCRLNSSTKQTATLPVGRLN